MKVLLTVWISAILIQEVVPNTLVRPSQQAIKNPSVVQTEYEAQYEQKGKHGNDSSGTVYGKQEIVHDNCAENWNSFADKCASLIKDLVASLANAVSSKPGDATNLRLQIKNTFSHFDNTHNCSCLNHTEKGLSDLDLTPIFKNISISTVSPANQKECGPSDQSCGTAKPEANDRKAAPNNGLGENNEFSSEPTKTYGQSVEKTCKGQNNTSQTGKDAEDCGFGEGVTKVPQPQNQPNRTLVEGFDSQMNPETAESSKEQLNSNNRRQISYPKFLIKQPQNESNSNSDPSNDGLKNLLSNYEYPNKQKPLVIPTPAPLLSKKFKPPIPSSSSNSTHTIQKNSNKSENQATLSPFSFIANSNITPSSDSQLLASSTSLPAPNYHQTAINKENPKGANSTVSIPFLPESNSHTDNTKISSVLPENFKFTSPAYLNLKQTSHQKIRNSSTERNHHDSPATTPIPGHSQLTVAVPIVTKPPEETNEGSTNESHHYHPSSTTPVPDPPTAIVPVATTKSPKEISKNSKGVTHYHHPSSTSEAPSQSQLTVAVPIVTKPPEETNEGSTNESHRHHHFSTTPVPSQSEPSVAIPIVTKPPEETNEGSTNEWHHSHPSSTTPVPDPPTAIVPVATTKSAKKNTKDSNDRSHHHHHHHHHHHQHHHHFSTTPVPDPPTAIIPVATTKSPKEISKNSKGVTHYHHPSSTSEAPSQSQLTVAVPIVTKPPEETNEGSTNESHYHHHFSNTPVTNPPTAIVPVATTKLPKETTKDSEGETHYHHPSLTTAIPGQTTAKAAITIKSSKEINGGANDDSQMHSFPFIPVTAFAGNPVTAATTESDVEKSSLEGSEKSAPSTKYDPNSSSGSQQETLVGFTSTPESSAQQFPYLTSGYQSQDKNSIPTVASSSTIPVMPQQQSTSAPLVLKASQPSLLIPSAQTQSKGEKGEDAHHIEPTTFQTTSIEPTFSNAYLPFAEKDFTTSLPTDFYKTIPMKLSTSPKTIEIQHDDEDDEEDCCSCESCTEEEITDPKLYKENACKNLEEARRELKAIFDKIKKKLKCGRKTPQSITTK